jgi:pyruvate/2-oxoglutarate dehydrogenase complex dihydrolipoamide acyltransferase (E2) component
MRTTRPWRLGLALCALAGAPAGAQEWFDCVMNPALRVNLASQIPGPLDEVLVDRGERVRKGQIVARLASEVEAAQVALDSARAQSTADIEAHQARVTLAQRELFQRQAATAQRVDEMQAQADIAAHELRLAEQAREVTKLELARSQAALRRAVRSPAARLGAAANGTAPCVATGGSRFVPFCKGLTSLAGFAPAADASGHTRQ